MISEEIVRGHFDSIVKFGVEDKEGREGREGSSLSSVDASEL